MPTFRVSLVHNSHAAVGLIVYKLVIYSGTNLQWHKTFRDEYLNLCNNKMRNGGQRICITS